MTDISKCLGRECKQKHTCYRYTAPTGDWQSFASFEEDIKKDKCPNYWPNKKTFKREDK